jgi:hypothetical protein
MTDDHDPNAAEKEMGKKLGEHQLDQKTVRAIHEVKTAIQSLDDDNRKLVLDKALREMGSGLTVQPGG